MKVGIGFVVVGMLTWFAMHAWGAIYVNRSDAENPIRRLVTGIGYLGAVAAAWGLILILLRFWSGAA